MSAQQNILSKKSTILSLIFTLVNSQSLYASELLNPLHQISEHVHNTNPDNSPKLINSSTSLKRSKSENQSSNSFKDISYILHESDKKTENHPDIPAQKPKEQAAFICPCFGWLLKNY